MSGYLIYILIGLIYWSVNIFIRKLHLRNEYGDGWFLSPFWLLGWPLCFLILIITYLEYLKTKYHGK